VEGELTAAVEGVLTSLPGAPHQRFHQDGPLKGSYNCFVPLVDVSAQKSGTEFWVGSHLHPAVPQLSQSGELGVAEAEELKKIAGDPDAKIVQPPLGAGDVLIYQYPVVHRCRMRPRPFNPLPPFKYPVMNQSQMSPAQPISSSCCEAYVPFLHAFVGDGHTYVRFMFLLVVGILDFNCNRRFMPTANKYMQKEQVGCTASRAEYVRFAGC
jgi:hypothetical protein